MNKNKKTIENFGRIKTDKTSNFEYKAKEEPTKTGSEMQESANFADFATSENKDINLVPNDTPYFSEDIYSKLPKLLCESSSLIHDKRQKDVYLISSLTVISGLLGNISGIYQNRRYSPNLYSFIVAPAGSGKGIMDFGKQLGMDVHDYLKNNNTYTSDLALSEIKPKSKKLFVPANISTAKLIKELSTNKESLIICENEADTLGEMQKQGWANYSDILRKAFHHETVSYSRLKDDVELEINNPKLSVILTGTPDQVNKIIPSDSNGLFSRFIFYCFEASPKWNDVTPKKGESLVELFSKYSKNVLDMYLDINTKDMSFEYTEEQWIELNNRFDKWHKHVNLFITTEANGSVHRLGLIMFRISMVLSAIRYNEEKSSNNIITCKSIDFETSFLIVEALLKHSLNMLNSIKKKPIEFNGRKLKFLNSLPIGEIFSRKDVLRLGLSFGICVRSFDDYLNEFVETGYLLQPGKAGEYLREK